MPSTAPPLLPVFRSRLQGRILALVLPDEDREWTASELTELTGEPYPTVAAELRCLEEAELVISRSVGRTKLIRTNQDSPYLRPLSQLATIAFGPPLVIAEEFDAVDGIDAIYIYGSWAARYEGQSGSAPDDIDVLILGGPGRDEVYGAARRAEQRLGREVNVTQRTTSQWDSATDGFARQVRASPLIEVPYRQTHARLEQGK